jgi:mono/diheme cytochrome c family protein
VQTLSLEVIGDSGKPTRKRIETRVMLRQQREWTGYSYRWNAEQTDAELIPATGDLEEFQVADPSAPDGRRDQVWRFPARTECLVCHSRAAGFVLGFSPLQLDRDHDFRPKVANQLQTFERIGLFEGDLPKPRGDRPHLVDPNDPSASLEARVKSYLHVNCSTCHVAEGGGNARMELGLFTPVRRMNIVDEVPLHDQFGIVDARIVAPGSPERSILWQRISRRGTGQMPPLMTTEVDQKAVSMIAEWIRSLPAANP